MKIYITELAQRLKAAAEKATPGTWGIEDTFGLCVTSDFSGLSTICDVRKKNDAVYISVTNPHNVLALVEALEKAQQDHRLHAARLISEKALLRERIAELEESNAQVIQSRDHYKRMTEEGLKQLAESRSVTIEPFRAFVTDADLAALHRFAECCDDSESDGHDLEKEQVRRLEAIGALQRSGRISYITGFGDVLISITAGIKFEGE